MTSKPETPPANEAAMIAEMTDILRRKMARDYAAGATRRDAHPKALGVVRGVFSVEPGLAPELRVGVFAEPAAHDCWLRFSNASGKPQSDAIPDLRGLGIKLMAPAKGRKPQASLGQDFVLLSHPTMPLGTVKLFRDAVFYSIERWPAMLVAKLLLTGHASVLKELALARGRPSSPLDIPYWSTTPYRFGAQRAVKYSLRPTSAHRSQRPASPGADYLGQALHQHLAAHPASFDFCVQLQEQGMPIEDAAVRWDETRSPMVKLATLTLAPQPVLTDERQALGETLSFSPGHAWPEHAPLGGINRARVEIYRQLSAFRHERDQRDDLA